MLLLLSGLLKSNIQLNDAELMDYNLLQRHTVEIYDLESHDCVLEKVKARTLLKPQRFDLFAKLYYIRNITSDPANATKVYQAHIKAFNPDGREPGRDDKDGVEDFVAAFDEIIEEFKSRDFDDTVSVVPVDKNGVILDGGHRVAALAFFDREVTIARFDDVESKCEFDYRYFLDRGLSWSICDRIAHEMTLWVDNLLIACLWPHMGNESAKKEACLRLSKLHNIVYTKKTNVNLKSLFHFVAEIYKNQSWTHDSASVKDKALRVLGNKSHEVWFVMFENNSSIDDIIEEKDRLRERYGSTKDSLHITDNIEETRQIAALVLLPQGVSAWRVGVNDKPFVKLSEKWHYFKNVTWINMKSRIWQLLHG